MLEQATVNVLPDDVLLDIFDFHRGDDEWFHHRDLEIVRTCMLKVAEASSLRPPGVCAWYSNVMPEHG